MNTFIVNVISFISARIRICTQMFVRILLIISNYFMEWITNIWINLFRNGFSVILGARIC